MKTRAFVAVTIIIALLLVASMVYAQGRAKQGPAQWSAQPGPGAKGPGFGRGAGFGKMGMPCPFGYTQPNPNAGGWWTRVKPVTKEQKAFIDEVAKLHNQIRERQWELNRLRASNGDPKKIASLEKELNDLRTRLHDVMINNQALMRQMGGPQFGRGYCDPSLCQNCPYKDTCPCYSQGKCLCPQYCPWGPGPSSPRAQQPPAGKPNANLPTQPKK